MNQFRLLRRGLASLRGVNAERNQELVEYQKSLHKMRLEYRAEFAKEPSKAQQIVQARAERAANANATWKAHLEEVRLALRDPNCSLYRDRHPCRPRIIVKKTPQQRMLAQQELSRALGRHQTMRRKYALLLAKELVGDPQQGRLSSLITKDNLDARIKHAIEHPVNYNISPEMMVQHEMQIRARLNAIDASPDERIVVAGEQFIQNNK